MSGPEPEGPKEAFPTQQEWERRAIALEGEELVLAELVNRVLDRGVMVAGDVTISVAGIDLVHLALRLRLSSSETLRRHRLATEGRGSIDPGTPLRDTP